MKSIDLSIIDKHEKPSFAGVDFDSRPAALRHLLVAKKIIDRHQTKKNIKGLDIGSKYGFLRKILKEFDIDVLRLDVVERDDNDGLIIGDGRWLPFEDNSLDFVVLSHVLAHVEDLPPFMAEIHRCLKPRGEVVVLQNNRYGWWKYWGYYLVRGNDRKIHYRTFSLWDIKELMRINKLNIQEINSPYYFYLHSKLSPFFYWLDRKFGHRIPNWISTQFLLVATKDSVALEGKPIKLPFTTRLFVEPIALLNAVTVKSLELGLRLVKKY